MELSNQTWSIVGHIMKKILLNHLCNLCVLVTSFRPLFILLI